MECWEVNERQQQILRDRITRFLPDTKGGIQPKPAYLRQVEMLKK